MTDDKIDLFAPFKRLEPLDLSDEVAAGKPADGYEFADSVKENWRLARHFVLRVLPPLDGGGIASDSGKSVQVVVQGTSALMLSIVRQIALVAHYPNFDERTGRGCTRITLLYDRLRVKDIDALLGHEEYLANLPKYCRCVYSRWGDGHTEGKMTRNENSFVDIELDLIGFDDLAESERYIGLLDADVLVLREQEVKDRLASVEEEDLHRVDIRDARRVNMVYCVGSDIDNLPPDDPNTADRYSRALHYFCYQQTPEDTLSQWRSFFSHGEVRGQVALRNVYSNVCCADCFDSRLRSVLTPAGFKRASRKDRLRRWKMRWCSRYASILSKKDGEAYDAEEVKWLLTHEYRRVLQMVKDQLPMLSRSEHARWVTEKLLLGFSPLDEGERLRDEQCFGAGKRAYRKQLKSRKDSPRHIDLCSYHDLRRINPEDMKYDSFLMMAMTWIVRCRE